MVPKGFKLNHHILIPSDWAWFYGGFEKRMTGTGSKRLNPKEFYEVDVLFPKLEEHEKIASVLSLADKEIEILQVKPKLLKQEKRALMQQLLAGKRRVIVDEIDLQGNVA